MMTALLTMNFYLRITLQKLAIEIFKFKHNLAPAILNDIFQTTSHEYKLKRKKFVQI